RVSVTFDPTRPARLAELSRVIEDRWRPHDLADERFFDIGQDPLGFQLGVRAEVVLPENIIANDLVRRLPQILPSRIHGDDLSACVRNLSTERRLFENTAKPLFRNPEGFFRLLDRLDIG